MHDGLFTEIKEIPPYPDEIEWFIDHWVYILGGVPVINGKLDDFEMGLRDFIRMREERAKNLNDEEHF